MPLIVETVAKTKVDPVDLDWNSILQKGAESLAQSLGSTIGGGIGEAFVNAILGKSNADDAFKQEVMSALSKIDAKLDEILAFLYQQLPTIIRKQVEGALVDQKKNDINAKATTISGLLKSLNALDRAPTEEELLFLADAGNSSFEMGLNVLQYGQEWYAAGLKAYISGFAAYVKLIKHSPHFGEALSEYSNAYCNLVAPWLTVGSPQKTSFADLSVSLPQELETARAVIAPMLGKKEYYALSWWSYGTTVYTAGKPTGVKWTFAVYGGWWIISPDDYSMTGDDENRIISSDPLPEIPQLDLVRETGFKVAPFWEPYQYGASIELYHQFVARLNAYTSAVVHHPARIEYVDRALQTSKGFFESCRLLDLRTIALDTLKVHQDM